MELLVPTAADLMGWGGVLVATLAFIGLGRLLVAAAHPEAALVAGWGAAAILVSLWGIITPASMRVPALAILAAGLLGLVLRRLDPAAWRSLLRLIAVALPLLLVMASGRPSLPDTFLNLLPNAAYLYDHGFFPADDRAPAYSLLPGAPYSLQIAGFIASLPLPVFPANAMIVFNLVLQLAFALLLARIISRTEHLPEAVPSWAASAAGLLLVTLVNPGFVPRYHLSAYSEPSVTVTTAFAAWFAVDALERLTARRAAVQPLLLLALTLAALVNIKQDSLALVAGLVFSALALAALRDRALRARSVALLLATAAPAIILYLAWRWYVLGHFAEGELKLLPFAEWNWRTIPEILRSVLGEMAEKVYFFGSVLIAFAWLVGRWCRRGLDRTTGIAAVFAGTTIIYNAAIFFTYIAHFIREVGIEAHSYFRYNTHLGLLLVLTLLLLARETPTERGKTLSGAARAATPALIAIAILSPIVFFGYIRFDLDQAQQRAWQLAAVARSALDRTPRLVLLLPGDDGSVRIMLEGLIRFTEPRHLTAELPSYDRLTADTLASATADGARFALLSCAPPPGWEGVPAGSGGLLEHAQSGWRVVSILSYQPSSIGRKSSAALAAAALCQPAAS